MYNNTMTNIVKEHPSVVSKEYILNANDRCDRCQAQALTKVTGTSGELMFCNHHYNGIMNDPDSYKKMMSFMLEIIDEREKLTENRLMGSAN
jgi:hypothetical protein